MDTLPGLSSNVFSAAVVASTLVPGMLFAYRLPPTQLTRYFAMAFCAVGAFLLPILIMISYGMSQVLAELAYQRQLSFAHGWWLSVAFLTGLFAPLLFLMLVVLAETYPKGAPSREPRWLRWLLDRRPWETANSAQRHWRLRAENAHRNRMSGR